ncbi:class F sortase [Streptomyces europaeiscabiei]|uniref:class F sortase n=1 Tax=Streptomyces TaxID=1883 RepID=UPI000A3C228F|nr:MULTISPECIES: class F sortase [Streptomyces]MDX3583904.1 class F sortase [Streptomyces europaeiscabiei]MDX3619470.1 class F sortase [Streptomyces europaeiscabiei]MDX3629649.1 class F sortase [Streptomyces europaeiscabiei]MDX3648266.1 class F sortase [Streptomyces europaeiscabiei]WUD32963.1 class F sortase [Streptomyces europaeiscabiei]
MSGRDYSDDGIGSGTGARPGSGTGRVVTGVAWAVLLLGLWLWGREVTDVRTGGSAPTTGDVAAVGRPALAELPPAAQPLRGARPQRLDIPSMGVQAPVVARGLDRDGAIEPPSYGQPGVVGWYAGGARPGATGAALFVGHVDTETRPAVFYKLSALRVGETIRVARSDGRMAEFTVDDVQVMGRDDFDAQQAYGVRQSGRAELRLVTCGGTFDRTSRTYTANVVVSAYLSGTGP